jgi:hypothetical protein
LELTIKTEGMTTVLEERSRQGARMRKTAEKRKREEYLAQWQAISHEFIAQWQAVSHEHAAFLDMQEVALMLPTLNEEPTPVFRCVKPVFVRFPLFALALSFSHTLSAAGSTHANSGYASGDPSTSSGYASGCPHASRGYP